MSKKDRLKSYLQKLKHSENPETLPALGLSETEREILAEISAKGLVDEAMGLMEELDVEGDWLALEKRLSKNRRPVIPIRKVLQYAAILVGAITLGLGAKWLLSQGVEPVYDNMITLDMGKNVTPFHEGKKQAIALPSGEVVAVKEARTLKYEPGFSHETVFNELHIPNGKMFTLILSDGTEVRLNSGTHIRYPVKFSKEGNREISMEGEAFFKVTHDPEHPFIVNSGGMAIEVMGTSFNVSAYADENMVNTVLVEGSVRLSHSSAPDNKVMLTPGKKGAWSKEDRTLSVGPVDTLLYTSWVDGEIVFRDTPFSELLNRLERTYNVRIVNQDLALGEKTFNARYNRNVESIETVMDALRVIVPFEYTVYTNPGDGSKEITIDQGK